MCVSPDTKRFGPSTCLRPLPLNQQRGHSLQLLPAVGSDSGSPALNDSKSEKYIIVIQNKLQGCEINTFLTFRYEQIKLFKIKFNTN